MKKQTQVRRSILAFDLDGTAIDSTFPGFQKVQTVLGMVGLPPADEEVIRRAWGKKFRDVVSVIVQSVGGNAQDEQEFIRLEHMLDDIIIFNDRLPWVLDQLRHQHYLAIITSRTRKSFDKIASRVNFDIGSFSFIQTLDDCPHSKPDPEVMAPLIDWANRLYIPQQNITFFGDTVHYDYAAVKNYPDIRFVGIVSGATKPSEFLSAGVHDIIHGVPRLPEFLEAAFLNNSRPALEIMSSKN